MGRSFFNEDFASTPISTDTKDWDRRLGMLYLKNTADLSEHRTEFFEGEEHLVIPTVAAVQGVLNGQLLPIASIEASLPAWEGVAVTMSHPKKNGQDVSANTKEAIEDFVIGRFFNAHIDGTKFKGEFWINLSKLDEHEDGDEFLQLVSEGATIEVSTSYWAKADNQSGIFEGKQYNGIQQNLVPNHVAILLHETGACSVEDGCGTPRTNKDTESDMSETITTNCDEERKKNALTKLRDKLGGMVMDTLSALDVNRISHGQIRDNLRSEITSQERSDSWVFIVDVFDDEVIYGRELATGEVDLFSRSYSVGSQPNYEINIDEPVEVQQVIDYQPVSNSQEEENHMDRDAIIERLVANEDIPFDAEQLASMTDDQIAHLATNLDAKPADDTEEVIKTPAADAPTDEPVQNASALSPEVVESLNALGADGIQNVVNASKELAEQRDAAKNALVSKMVANSAVTIDEATLRRMDLEGLEGVARMAGLDVSYVGAGGPVANQKESSGPPPAPSIVLDEPKSE